MKREANTNAADTERMGATKEKRDGGKKKEDGGSKGQGATSVCFCITQPCPVGDLQDKCQRGTTPPANAPRGYVNGPVPGATVEMGGETEMKRTYVTAKRSPRRMAEQAATGERTTLRS